DIDYVEAHGTGTTLGDPIEAGALAAVFGPRANEQALRLGSLKSNLAHTQAAAGVSGLIKVVLSLQHELLPKSLYADTPTAHVEWENSGLALVSAPHVWKRGARVRRAGVSAFGISGTNAHVIVEEAPPLPAAPARAVPRLGGWPLVVSARDARGLSAQAERLATWLEEHPDVDLSSVAYTAALHRTHFEQRAAVLASDTTQAVSALRALAAGEHAPTMHRGEQQRGGKLVFVFPGQGSQWPGMGRALLAQSPTFARAVEACDRALLPLTGWSVLALLRGDSAPELPPLDRVDAVQPALFALSIGLVAVLRTLGIEPDAVVGHSQGEVTAAVVSGALSLEDGAKVVALRSQAVRSKSGQGGMLLIERPVGEVAAMIEPYGPRLSIAAVNTASSTVVSGELSAIDALAAALEHQTLFVRKVNVDYASHSQQMDSLLPALGEALSDIRPRAGAIPLYSTVRCERLSGEELDAAYFCRNLRDPVRLDRALDQLLADGHGVFVEVSAHPVLTLSLAELRDRASAIVVGSLQRERGELSQLLSALCELHVQGFSLPWRALLSEAKQELLPLPTYAFQRQRYWLEPSGNKPASSLTSSDHPLLGAAVA
ncbi:MAG TPA: type I polyketide synthase, partial [Polyangiales bacterium]|nr:type I polyketide synthase [Polyangiales bacterium]